ncbi:MAG: HAD-superfamily hydrolase, subfamily variant 3 [Bacteroidetes bacterium]|nr:HAD-superfamily hydrolase, subfamily variant 3 [Bacteroidota bacterium]
MLYKGLVFDFNGTLVWDTPHHNRAFDIFLEKHGIALTDEEKSVKIYGKTNPDIMRGLFERALTDREIEDFSIEKETIYQELIIDELKFAPGVETLFNSLKNNNIPFTIATSADIFNVDFYFREMHLDRWFTREMVVYNDGTLKGKPEPDIFLRAAARMQLSPSELIIFEDSKAGIKAAERAGAGKIYIVDSVGDAELKKLGHELITNFNQVDLSLFA